LSHYTAKKRRLQRLSNLQGLKIYALMCAFFSLSIVLVIIGTLFIQSIPVLLTENTSLIGTHWSPSQGQFGVLPMLFGSVFVMAIAMIVAFPIGLLAAVYIAETRSSQLRRYVKSFLEILGHFTSSKIRNCCGCFISIGPRIRRNHGRHADYWLLRPTALTAL